MVQFQSVFITGASSGLGKALASAYAAQGVTLFLCGRHAAHLAETENQCRAKGATVHTFLFDVTDEKAVAEAVEKADALVPLQLVIANAGVSGGVLGEAETAEQTRQVMSININGVVNTVLPTLALFRQRKSGQVAIIASVAGYRGLPSAPAYSASKACVKAWGEALRGWLMPEGVKINVVCPGFIKTPLTDTNVFSMPFLMQPDKAAHIIQRGIARNKAIIAFPVPMAFSGWLMGALPACLIHPILRHLPQK